MSNIRQSKLKKLELQMVNNHTRAKIDGTELICPNCAESTKVYHFCWSGISCLHCQKLIQKTDWYIIKKIKS
jgi:hypothetical protein